MTTEQTAPGIFAERHTLYYWDTNALAYVVATVPTAGGGGGGTVIQGTAAALAGAWPVKVTDGTNVQPTGDTSARTIHMTVDNASLPVTGTFWQVTQPVSGTFFQTTQPVSGTFFQATQPVSLTSLPALAAGAALIGSVQLQASTLVVTTLSVAATTVTATLPAAGASLFHYITRIEIVRVSTAAVTGTAVLGYTSTNLPGSWARSAGNAIAIGATVKDVDESLSSPLKSSVANTATTIVAPSGGTGVQVRITVYYYTGP